MAEAAERLGQIPDVRLHPAGDLPRVGADDADLHGSPSVPLVLLVLLLIVAPALVAATASGPGSSPATGRSRAGSRSATNTFCSMCQSSGCSRMPASKKLAICWVIAATF